MGQREYISWPTDAKIPLFLAITGTTGAGDTGATPEIAIRRFRETHGVALDNYYWDGAGGFQAAPNWIALSEYDATNNPGLYTYLFEQDLVGLEHTYVVYYRNTTGIVGFATEIHVITNEVYVPNTQPDPIVIGPDSVMGQLELVKDGGSALFNPTTDPLHFLALDSARTLGLLHQNAILDNQTYDANNQLIAARLRVFDSAANVPTTPGGGETTGLIQEYAVEASYTGLGILNRYALKRVT